MLARINLRSIPLHMGVWTECWRLGRGKVWCVMGRGFDAGDRARAVEEYFACGMNAVRAAGRLGWPSARALAQWVREGGRIVAGPNNPSTGVCPPRSGRASARRSHDVT
jgi:transposase-like protein